MFSEWNVFFSFSKMFAFHRINWKGFFWRFLVLCSYQPETLTVRAGLSLPNSRGQAHLELAPAVEEADNYLGRKARNMRVGRLLHKPQALGTVHRPNHWKLGQNNPNFSVQEDAVAADAQISPKSQIVPVFVVTMLSIAGVIGLVAIVLKISGRKLMEDMDNVSIASDLSTASTSSVVSIEESGDEKQEKWSCALQRTTVSQLILIF